MAIGELKPGNAPTKTPINTPPKINKIFCHSSNSPSPFKIGSII